MGTHPIFESDFDCLTEMGDNEKVEPVDDEVLSDNESVDSDDYIPEGCQKLYYLNDGPAKQYITMDNGSELLTFRANRKPAEKYYETIKKLLLDAEAHDLYAVDSNIECLELAHGNRRFMNERALGRAQGFLMAYDLIKGLKTEATLEKTPEPTPEELEEWSQSRAYLDSQNQDPEYLEGVKKLREGLEQMWAENPGSRPDFRYLKKIGAAE